MPEVLDAGAYLETLALVWDEATMPERREMTLMLLERAECDPAAKRLTRLQPRPDFAPLFKLAGIANAG